MHLWKCILFKLFFLLSTLSPSFSTECEYGILCYYFSSVIKKDTRNLISVIFPSLHSHYNSNNSQYNSKIVLLQTSKSEKLCEGESYCWYIYLTLILSQVCHCWTLHGFPFLRCTDWKPFSFQNLLTSNLIKATVIL